MKTAANNAHKHTNTHTHTHSSCCIRQIGPIVACHLTTKLKRRKMSPRWKSLPSLSQMTSVASRRSKRRVYAGTVAASRTGALSDAHATARLRRSLAWRTAATNTIKQSAWIQEEATTSTNHTHSIENSSQIHHTLSLCQSSTHQVLVEPCQAQNQQRHAHATELLQMGGFSAAHSEQSDQSHHQSTNRQPQQQRTNESSHVHRNGEPQPKRTVTDCAHCPEAERK